MNKETKSYKVDIFGQEYSLISDESSEHILAAAMRVDELMKLIEQASGLTDANKIAVLAALKLSSELLSHQKNEQDNQQACQSLISAIDQEIDTVLAG